MGDLSKNFSRSEFACHCCGTVEMNRALVSMLQQLRDKIGYGLSITSGYRCPAHNKKVGGVEGSAHTIGLAVDIRCLSGGQRFQIIKAAIDIGFSRIGISGQFIHIDTDQEKVQNVIWTY